jgi:SAM-dependent methyltransferase
MDVTLNPYVDLVGDVHRLPFRDESVDFAFGGAVFEHLEDPWRAAEELWRVLRPGGYVYADWNFVFAYHGYPHHYFNASPHAMDAVFRRFTKLGSGVAPFHAPSFALRSVLGTYLELFQPVSDLQRELAADLTRVLRYPLERFNDAISHDQWFRVAAGHYFFGVKQSAGLESVIPPVVLDAHRQSADLQRRFPHPLDLSVPDNLMIWAKTEGRQLPAIDAFFRALRPFTKREGFTDRSIVEGWPLELMAEPDALPGADRNALLLEAGRPWRTRLRETWDHGGLRAVLERGLTGIGRRVGWHRD